MADQNTGSVTPDQSNVDDSAKNITTTADNVEKQAVKTPDLSKAIAEKNSKIQELQRQLNAEREAKSKESEAIKSTEERLRELEEKQRLKDLILSAKDYTKDPLLIDFLVKNAPEPDKIKDVYDIFSSKYVPIEKYNADIETAKGDSVKEIERLKTLLLQAGVKPDTIPHREQEKIIKPMTFEDELKKMWSAK